MNYEEILTLRRSFDLVKQRQQMIMILRIEKKSLDKQGSYGNEELLEEAVEKLRNNGIKVYLAKEKQDAIDAILAEVEEKL